MTLALAGALACLLGAACGGPGYETVGGDPMHSKIYTLDNGLKVYMTVNKEQPTLQTYIAVRVGSKDDPHDNTGLSHYLEHLMFKGTESFGTSDYAAEKPLLDSISALFETYRATTDPAAREALYRQIDDVSHAASEIAIPNEYDKLMTIIGASGTNAFTSNDMTVYQETIPSNEIDSWARIEADRFMHPVIRGFHTELEAVYEEKNMSLTEDDSKAMEAIDSVLFAHHPYGLQTTLGTQEHLKNPSILAIERHRDNFYVPNNVAICVSGDFDPDEFVATVEKYFGSWQPNPDIKTLEYESEQPITEPVVKTVYGLDADFVMVGWRTPGDRDLLESEAGDVVSSVLYNGKAGLFDLDLVQTQKVGNVYAFNYTRSDYGEFLLVGYPRAGQSLEEVRELMLAEVGKLRSGDFDESLISSSVNNFKLQEMRQLERNSSRAMAFVQSFISGRDWAQDVHQMDRLERLTKDQVVTWARKYLGDSSHVTAYKRQGVDAGIEKIAAPKITPIETNRDKRSDFLAEIQAVEVKPIEPVFVDFNKDMSVSRAEGLELLYKRNEINDIARVDFVYDRGVLDDPRLELALGYLGYLGTPTRSAEDIAREMYSLACSYSLRPGDSQTRFGVTGLDENVGQAMDIFEDLVLNAVPDEEILEGVKSDLFKGRADAKLSQRSCFSALTSYLMYGPEYIRKTTLTDEQISALTSGELLGLVRELYAKRHEVLYYGPSSEASARKLIASHHNVPDDPQPLVRTFIEPRVVSESEVVIAPYDANQFYYLQYSDRGEKFDVSSDADVAMYNSYFGGGMNGIVFQEMRESRALAYSASAYLAAPRHIDGTYMFYAFIASQNDKLRTAVEAFDGIINDMPESQAAFDIAKSGLVSNLRVRRTTGFAVLDEYLDLRDLGLKEDRNKAVFEAVQGMTLEDVKAVQERWIKGRTYLYGFLGNADAPNFDMGFVKTLGPVTRLTLEDIFGY